MPPGSTLARLGQRFAAQQSQQGLGELERGCAGHQPTVDLDAG
jgi:hypothetical protein